MTDEMQEKFMEFQMLQKHIEHIQEQVTVLQQQLLELDISAKAIEEIGTAKEGNEILAPVANGIFVKTRVENVEQMVVNVGSNVMVERTPTEVVGLLKEQQEKIRTKVGEANELLQELQDHAMKIFKEVE